MTGRKVIEYIIAAKDATASAIRSALGRVRSFAAGVGAQLANIQAGFSMLARGVSAAASVIGSAIGEAFKFEKAVANFKTLLGSVDAAKAHIAELKAFASATPLTFDDLAGASKLILSFGGDVDSIMPNLKMLGDIAMGDSQKFKGLALVFAQVQSCGKLMGQDLLQMINQGFNPLTVIAQQTGKSMAELKDMVSEGSISFEMVAEAMRVATSEGGLFCGAMDEASKTGEGMVSTLKDKWSDAVRAFGEAFGDVAKNGLQKVIDKIAELTENGTVAVWAQNAVDAIGDVVSACRTAAEWVGKIAGPVWKTMRGAADSVGNAVGGFAGTLAGGGGLGDALKAAGSGYKQGWVDAFDTDGAEARDRAARRSAASARLKARREAEAAAQGASGQSGAASTTETLSQMMEKIDAKRAEKEAQKKEEAARKAAAAEAKRQEQLRKEEEKARLAVEKRIHAERVKLMQSELAERESEQSAAEARLAEAQSKVRQAWGWYRDKDSLAAQIAEEKADAEARKQYEKDFERLSFRRDWRTADNLSLDDEAVRRVALAKEEEQAAKDAVAETAENTRRAAESLEAIEAAFEEGGE